MSLSPNHDQLDQFIKASAKNVPAASDHLKHRIRAKILDEADEPRFFLFRPRTWMIIASPFCIIFAALAVMYGNLNNKPVSVSDADLEAYLDETVLGTMQSVEEDDSLELEIYSLK